MLASYLTEHSCTFSNSVGVSYRSECVCVLHIYYNIVSSLWSGIIFAWPSSRSSLTKALFDVLASGRKIDMSQAFTCESSHSMWAWLL